jgi:nicotinic acid mononucleotide adenylyltransferase
MDSITYINDNLHGCHASRIAAMVGSFDCLHLGHEWCIDYLIQEYGNVLLLIPRAHPEKTVKKNRNATLWQRTAMLRTLEKRHGAHLGIGLTREIFFVRLFSELTRNYAPMQISFGMGSDTFGKVRETQKYFECLRYPWTAVEERQLDAVVHNAKVFDRSLSNPNFIFPPPDIASISSSRVRQVVQTWWEARNPEDDVRRRLRGLVSEEIVELIMQWGIYRMENRQDSVIARSAQ